MKCIIYSILLCLFFTYGQAQEMSPKGKEHHGGKHEMIEQEKIPFFTKQLSLTPDEAKAFWPLYYEFEKKKRNLIEKKHNIGRKTMDNEKEVSEKEAQEINTDYLKIEADELALEQEYNEKFKKILPIQKVNKLYFVEHQFRVHLLNKLKNSPPPPPHNKPE